MNKKHMLVLIPLRTSFADPSVLVFIYFVFGLYDGLPVYLSAVDLFVYQLAR